MVVAFHGAERDLIGCMGVLCVKAFGQNTLLPGDPLRAGLGKIADMPAQCHNG